MKEIIDFLNEATKSQLLFGIHYFPIYGKLFGLNVVVIYYAGILSVVIWFLLKVAESQGYGEYLLTRFGYVLIGGRFANGKTRLLTKFAEMVRGSAFVCANYFYGNNFCPWTSKEDLGRLLDDLLFLSEIQNFTKEERIEIRKQFPHFVKEKEIQEFKKKYKHIPVDTGTHCEFFIPGDEFHQYFINREAMSNFTGELGKRFNQTLHQVRHFGVLMVLATQEIENMDLKFRQLASYEIDTLKYLRGLLYGYNFFDYIPNKRHTKEEADERQFRKINRFPILFVNWFEVNKLMRQWEFVLRNFAKYSNMKKFKAWCVDKMPTFSNFFRKQKEEGRPMSSYVVWISDFMDEKAELPTFDKLPFNTKYNVNRFVDSYHQGKIFERLNEFFKKCPRPMDYQKFND